MTNEEIEEAVSTGALNGRTIQTEELVRAVQVANGAIVLEGEVAVDIYADRMLAKMRLNW